MNHTCEEVTTGGTFSFPRGVREHELRDRDVGRRVGGVEDQIGREVLRVRHLQGHLDRRGVDRRVDLGMLMLIER
jgi:hypothetical protein